MSFMEEILDKKDLAILEILEENARLSSQEISKKTLIPISTVHHRIKKLEKEGIIEKYTINLNKKKLGKEVASYILIIVDYKLLREMKMSQYELAKKIKKNKCVEEAAMITGGTDIIIKVRVKNIEELNEFVTKYLRNIEGVEKTQTMVILNEV